MNPKIEDVEDQSFELIWKIIVWSDWKANAWSYYFNSTAEDTLENSVTLKAIQHSVQMYQFEYPIPNIILESQNEKDSEVMKYIQLKMTITTSTDLQPND